MGLVMTGLSIVKPVNFDPSGRLRQWSKRRVYKARLSTTPAVRCSNRYILPLHFHRQNVNRLDYQLNLVADLEVKIVHGLGGDDGSHFGRICHFELNKRHNVAQLDRFHFPSELISCPVFHNDVLSGRIVLTAIKQEQTWDSAIGPSWHCSMS